MFTVGETLPVLAVSKRFTGRYRTLLFAYMQNATDTYIEAKLFYG